MSFQNKDLIDLDFDKLSDDQVVEFVNNFMHDSMNGNREWRTRAVTSMNYYRGNQWTNNDIAFMAELDIPRITINLIKPQVNFLAGTQKKIRKDIKVVPVKVATHTEAKILTHLIKNIMDKSNGQQLISEQYKEGATTGKGWLKVSIDKTYDVERGDFKIENLSSFNVYEDPNPQEYDLDISGKFIIEVRWEDKDKIIKKYPNMEDQLVGLSASNRTFNNSSLIDWSDGHGPDITAEDDELRNLDRDNYKYKILECWCKTYEKRKHWIDKINLTDKIITTKEDIETAEKATKNNSKRFSIVESVDAILWKLITTENLLLEKVKEPFKNTIDTENDLDLQPAVNLFPYFRYIYDFTNGRAEGVVDDLVGPQNQKNKLDSQILHIIGSAANKGWIYEQGSLSNDMEQALEDEGSRTGFNLKYLSGKQAPVKIPSNELPAAHQFLSQQADTNIEKISGINQASKGQTTSGESGKLNQLRQVQGLTINSTSFDNLDYTMKLLGNFLHEVIRSTDIYSKEEIEAVLDDVDLVDIKSMQKASDKVAKTFELPDLNAIISRTDPALVRDSLIAYEKLKEEFDNRVLEEAKKFVMKRIKNIYKGRYGINISESNFSETIRQKRIDEILLLEQLRPGLLPTSVLIDTLDLQEKESIIALIQAREQQLQQVAQINANVAPQPEQNSQGRPVKRNLNNEAGQLI